MNNASNYMARLHWLLFVFLSVAICFILGIIFNFLIVDTSFSSPPEIKEMEENLLELFFISVLIVPLLETLIFQTIPIRFINFIFFKLNFDGRVVAIIISALLFSLNHTYNYYYAVYTFFMGIILASTYTFSLSKRNENTFVIITLVHSLYNLLVFILRDI